MASKRNALRGYLFIAAAALFWGLSATLGKAAFTGRLTEPSASPLDPLILAQTRTTISFLVLLPLLWLVRRLAPSGDDRPKMSRADIGRCMLVGILGIAASNYFYYLAIAKTTVATAIILQYTAPIWVLLYMVARGRQRATLPRVAAVAMAVAGSALAIGAFGGGTITLNVIGVVAAQAAAISFAFYNVFGHTLVERFDRWNVILYALLGAALFWLIVNPPWKVLAAHYSREQWLFLIVFAFSSMLIPFSLYFAGLQHLDATRAIVTSCLEPVFAIVFAVMFVGESVHLLQVPGIVLVLAATVLVQKGNTGRLTGPILPPVE